MRIGIVGLGLIGGSLAKAFHRYTDCEVRGMDTNKKTMEQACSDGVIQGKDLMDCDLVFVCLHPRATTEFMRNAELMPGCIVADTCGIKRYIRDAAEKPVEDKGFRYVGTHPMAGREVGGYVSSLEDLFVGASWILTKDETTDPEALETLRDLFYKIGVKTVPVVSAEEHDRIIAYTSQMAHVVSNAYVKNKAALEERGFSAGSFQDLTRVARLDPSMWTELFIANAGPLVDNLDEFLGHVQAIRDSIAEGDEKKLHALLADGSLRRERLTRMEESVASDKV